MGTINNPASVIASDRHEVPSADHWDDESGSDFFFEPDAAQIVGTGLAEDLTDVGWTITSIAGYTEGTDADFLSSADKGVPGHYVTDAGSDLIQSPAVFGDYTHGQQAAHHLGHDPTTLTLEAWAAFSVHSANETATGLGFVINGGSIITAANAIAVIHTDGTNFTVRSGADSDLGATDDALWHLFKIVITTGSATDAVEWFIDGTSQGTMNRRTDAYPAAVGWGVVSGGTNRVLIGPARVFYR